MSFTYDHARPALSVDCVVFGLDEEDLKVLLIQRDLPPFAGKWALPGGFVDVNETLDNAARRELREETCIDVTYLEQLYTFGAVNRDPRDRVVSVAYYALVKLSDYRVQAATDVRNVGWYSIGKTPKLAFDHATILQLSHERLQEKVRYQPLGFELLPSKFTLRQLQHLYETILGRPLDKRNFRRKILGLDVLRKLDDYQSNVAHRAARLYRFDKQKYRRLMKQGMHFEI